MRLNDNLQVPVGTPTALSRFLYDTLQAIVRKVNALSDGRLYATDNVATAAPTSGTWAQGDFVRNSNPTDTDGATIFGWLCVAAGTPGTWVPITGRESLTDAVVLACSDETTALTTGTGKLTFRMPYAFTLSEVRASLTTAQTSGSTFTVDVNKSGSTVLSTKITIDNGEKTSTTAATPPALSSTSLADDEEISVDIDQIGDGTAKGLKVVLIGTHA